MKVFERIFGWLSAAFLFCVAVTIFVQVIARYVFGLAVSWTEEAARFFCVWMVFTGAIVASLKESHIRISFILERMSRKAKATVELLTYFAMIQFLVIILLGSVQLIVQNRQQTAVTMPISIGWLYAPAALFSLVSIVAFLFLARKSISDLYE
ncbi:MAG: TRAP transporter small permease [Planctomycetota bacterium]|jgi:TRAP-type C4-dicarboxylate transport system permease small subunit